MSIQSEVEEFLSEHLDRCKGTAWKVQVNVGGSQPVIVSCKDARIEDWKKATVVDCTIQLEAAELVRIVRDGVDPRYATLYRRMLVSGSQAVATKFCDALAGRKYSNRLLNSGDLPSPTSDLAVAKVQLETFGYCIIKNALESDQLRLIRNRLTDQAKGEEKAGIFRHDGAASKEPPNQRVWNLVNKGQEFIDLLEHPIVLDFAPNALGDDYLVSRFAANIARPGGKSQYLHTDQISIQPPINQAVGLNIVWFLDDVTEENGGTRILPGSHRHGIAPDDIMSTEGTVAASGPAGSALIFPSTLWHGTGSNRTESNRHLILSYFVKPWVRTLENAFLSTHPSVLADMSEPLKALHGFKCTDGMGGVEGAIEGQLSTYDPHSLTLRLEPTG